MLVDAATERSAGAVAVWVARHEIRRLRLFVGGIAFTPGSSAVGPAAAGPASPGSLPVGSSDDALRSLTADLARRIGFLAVETSCAAVIGTDLVDVEPAAVPAPAGAPGAIPPAAASSVALFDDVGLETVVEHGVVKGEVWGLEVARIEVEDDAAVLGVGVGRFDREITAMLHADLPDRDALERAAAIVRHHRHPGAPPHPLQAMAHARWLRAALIGEPALLDMATLVALDTTVEPPNLRDPHPAAALGRDTAGRRTLVVCTSGVDLDAVTLAADTRARHAPDATLVMVTPQGARVSAIEAVGDLLSHPPTWCEIPAPWN